MNESHGMSVGPHFFTPLRWWDRGANGRCRACFVPRSDHPVFNWVEARALGDTRRPFDTDRAASAAPGGEPR